MKMNKMYEKVNELILADQKYDEARDDIDEIIEEIIKEKVGIDAQVGTFLDCEDVYFEIQNMLADEIAKYEKEIEIATETERRVTGYSFYFDCNKL